VPIQNLGLPDQAVLEFERFYTKLDAGSAVPFTVGKDHACMLLMLCAIARPSYCRKGPKERGQRRAGETILLKPNTSNKFEEEHAYSKGSLINANCRAGFGADKLWQ
jgi:hypothetical protein